METNEETNVWRQIEGESTIITFLKDDAIIINSHVNESAKDKRKVITVGNRKFSSIDASDPIVSSLAGSDSAALKEAALVVTDCYETWQQLDWDEQRKVEEDFGRIIEAYRIKAETDSLMPVDADILGSIYSTRIDALVRRTRTELPA